VRGISLSIRESFFLRAVAKRRRRTDPPEDSPKSMLGAIGKEVQGCVSTWTGVSLSALPTSKIVSI
jgi:hypothetical protein